MTRNTASGRRASVRPSRSSSTSTSKATSTTRKPPRVHAWKGGAVDTVCGKPAARRLCVTRSRFEQVTCPDCLATIDNRDATSKATSTTRKPARVHALANADQTTCGKPAARRRITHVPQDVTCPDCLAAFQSHAHQALQAAVAQPATEPATTAQSEPTEAPAAAPVCQCRHELTAHGRAGAGRCWCGCAAFVAAVPTLTTEEAGADALLREIFGPSVGSGGAASVRQALATTEPARATNAADSTAAQPEPTPTLAVPLSLEDAGDADADNAAPLSLSELQQELTAALMCLPSAQDVDEVVLHGVAESEFTDALNGVRDALWAASKGAPRALRLALQRSLPTHDLVTHALKGGDAVWLNERLDLARLHLQRLAADVRERIADEAAVNATASSPEASVWSMSVGARAPSAAAVPPVPDSVPIPVFPSREPDEVTAMMDAAWADEPLPAPRQRPARQASPTPTAPALTLPGAAAVLVSRTVALTDSVGQLLERVRHGQLPHESHVPEQLQSILRDLEPLAPRLRTVLQLLQLADDQATQAEGQTAGVR